MSEKLLDELRIAAAGINKLVADARKVDEFAYTPLPEQEVLPGWAEQQYGNIVIATPPPGQAFPRRVPAVMRYACMAILGTVQPTPKRGGMSPILKVICRQLGRKS